MGEFSVLFEQKAKRLAALKLCDAFVRKAAYEAARDPLSISFYGYLRSAADSIPEEFEAIDSNPGVKVQDRRLQPYLRSQLFVALVSEFEDFIKTLLQIVIAKHPQKIGSKTIEIKDLVAKGYDAALMDAIESYLNGLFYKKPNEYRKSLVDILSITDDSVLTDWAVIVEMKARRDAGVHNGWQLNKIYECKVVEAGGSVPAGSFLGIDDIYFESRLDTTSAVMLRLADHCESTFAV